MEQGGMNCVEIQGGFTFIFIATESTEIHRSIQCFSVLSVAINIQLIKQA